MSNTEEYKDYKIIGSWVYNSKIRKGGGFSKVYFGRNPDTDQKVAIKKILSIKFGQDHKHYIKREIETILRLKSQFIVELYDKIFFKNTFFLIMEYCNQGTLNEYFKENRLDQKGKEEILRKFFINIITGYMLMLAKGIIHRDLKPQNILISNEIAKIADFGFAKPLVDVSISVNLIGNRFGAPDEKFSQQSDIYSLGAIMFYILTGEIPDSANSKNFLKLECQLELRIIILKMISIDPCKRYTWEKLNELLCDKKVGNLKPRQIFICKSQIMKPSNVKIENQEFSKMKYLKSEPNLQTNHVDEDHELISMARTKKMIEIYLMEYIESFKCHKLDFISNNKNSDMIVNLHKAQLFHLRHMETIIHNLQLESIYSTENSLTNIIEKIEVLQTFSKFKLNKWNNFFNFNFNNESKFTAFFDELTKEIIESIKIEIQKNKLFLQNNTNLICFLFIGRTYKNLFKEFSLNEIEISIDQRKIKFCSSLKKNSKDYFLNNHEPH